MIKLTQILNEDIIKDYLFDDSLNKIVKGFNLVPYPKGFGKSYVTKNGKTAPILINKINEFIQKLGASSAIKAVHEKTYNTIMLVKLKNLEEYDKNLIGPEYGEGMQHIVYSYGKDKVIKFDHYGEGINPNIKIFNKYPDIFPKTYEITDKYAIIELLDDYKSKNELYNIKGYIFNRSSEIAPKNLYIAKLSKRPRTNGPFWYKNSVTQLIYNNLEDNNLKLQLKNELPNELYNSLIKNYYPLFKKIKNIPWSSKITKDINDENFGYSSNGKLKMLDI